MLGLLGCCSCSSGDSHGPQAEIQVTLSSDMSGIRNMKQSFMRADSFDITFTPRAFNAASTPNPLVPMTPRQQDLKAQLELPVLHIYPTPPMCSPDEPEEQRKEKLLEVYKQFALDLHAGMYLTQLNSTRDYSDIHCQLMEDMQTLKLDQSNGRIIEFPLTGVSKVYRIIKSEDQMYSAGTGMTLDDGPNMEHIVVVEFMRRKLAFVFKELQVSQRFLMCMELLIRRAQQVQAKKALRTLTPAIQQGQQQQTPPSATRKLTSRSPPSPDVTGGTARGAQHEASQIATSLV